METGWLIDQYYIGPCTIQKRAVCNVDGKLLTYSYEAFSRNTTFGSGDYLTEKEALEAVFNHIKCRKKAIDADFYELMGTLNKEFVMKNNYDGMVKHIDELIEENSRMQKYCEDVITKYCSQVFKENFEEIVKNVEWDWFVSDGNGDNHILYFSEILKDAPPYIETLFKYIDYIPYLKIQCKEGICFNKSFDKFLTFDFDSAERMLEFSKTVNVHIVE